MQLTEGYRLTALRNAQQFLADHADDLPKVAQTGASRRLDSILDELSWLVTEQAAATLLARGVTGRLHYLRRRLFEDHLTPITRIARAELADHPALIAFRMPRTSTPSQRLAAVALGMAHAAAPHAAVFIAAGLQDDFVGRLEEAVHELLEAYTTRASWRGRARGATIGITTRLADGRRAVEVLDSFVRSATRERKALWGAWSGAHAVPARPGRRAANALPPVSEEAQMLTAPIDLVQPLAATLLPSRETRLLAGPSPDTPPTSLAAGTTSPA